MGGTRNLDLINLSQEIWNYLLNRQITITFEYLPGIQNVIADKESRVMKDFSEWKLNRKNFLKITSYFGWPEIDLFASRVLHQLPVYISWKQDPYSRSQDAFQSKWKYKLSYAFPPFCLIGRVLEKAQRDQSCLILITPRWQAQPWFPRLLKMSVGCPILLPRFSKLLTNP